MGTTSLIRTWGPLSLIQSLEVTKVIPDGTVPEEVGQGGPLVNFGTKVQLHFYYQTRWLFVVFFFAILLILGSSGTSGSSHRH